MGSPFKGLGKAVRRLSKLRGKSTESKKLVPKLTLSLRTAQMYNRRDRYEEVLKLIIRENPEEFAGMNDYTALERAHKMFQQGVSAGRIQILPGEEWMVNVPYSRMHGATSMEDWNGVNFGLGVNPPEGMEPMIINDTPVYSKEDFWHNYLDPQRRWFTGGTDWTNYKK